MAYVGVGAESDASLRARSPFPVEHIHRDAASTGRVETRPGFIAALAELAAMRPRRGRRVLVVSTCACLGAPVDVALALAHVARLGAQLVALEPLESPAERMFGITIGELAGLLRDHAALVKTDRIRSTLARKKARGQKRSGILPYGYELGADGKTLVPDRAEQYVIHRIAQLRDRMSLRQIGALLIEEGHKPRSATVWSAALIRLILARAEEQR